jgi:hypothetical protein
MKKVKIEGHHNKGLYFYEWRFTEDEKQEIRRALRGETTRENIELFIRHAEFFCDAKKERLEDPSQKKIRATRGRILTDCKATLSHLKQIERGRVITCNDKTLDAYGAGSQVADPAGDFILEQLESAWATVGPLQKFIKSFEAHHLAEVKKQGRPGADADHFAKKIRDCYMEHIGKPTTYETGAFFTVVKVIREILGLKFEDPSKTIKAALKSKRDLPVD